MSAFRIIPFFLISALSFGQHVSADIDTLLVHKDYFAAETLYKKSVNSLTAADRLYLGARIDNAYNRSRESLQKIDSLLRFPDIESDRMIYALETAHAGYARLGRYRDAARSLQRLLKDYDNYLSDESKDDYKNSLRIWQVLSSTPAQKVEIADDTRIRMTRDKAQLWTIPVTYGDSTGPFIFDTGANISTVTISMAKKMGMKIMRAGIEVNSVTGNVVKADLAVCPELHIGNVTVRNAIFLVFPDDALYIRMIRYQINGIMGFPIIEACREFTITQEGELLIPKKADEHGIANLALDFLTPVVLLEDGVFIFDSGANSTTLYPNWYNAHRTEITESLENDLRYGGAGGVIRRSGYHINWRPTFDQQTVSIPDVMVFPEVITESERYFSGSIGQDFIRQFKSYTMNFAAMRLTFN